MLSPSPLTSNRSPLLLENELENERKDFKNNIGFYYKVSALRAIGGGLRGWNIE